jgi:hypothetical protein
VSSHSPPNYARKLTKLSDRRSWHACQDLGRLVGFPFSGEHPDKQIIGALMAWILLEDLSKQLDSLRDLAVITFKFREAHHDLGRITGTIQCGPQHLPRFSNPAEFLKTVGPCTYPGGSVVSYFRSPR